MILGVSAFQTSLKERPKSATDQAMITVRLRVQGLVSGD
jgi:hypothetical protein